MPRRSKKKKKSKARKWGNGSPWFIGIVGGLIGAFVVGACLYYFYGHRELEIYRAIALTSLNDADRLLEKNMVEDALAIYVNVAGQVSARKDPALYANVKNSEGVCYYRLALAKNTEANLLKAVNSFHEALRIRTVEKYPLDYATTENNLGNSYRALSEVKDKKENLARAFEAFEKALKILTRDKYPAGYATTQNNLGAAYATLSEVADKESNLLKAIKAFHGPCGSEP
jgi:tetratricopeptide (TPR) repeat protein